MHNRLKPGDRFGRFVVVREKKIQTGKDWRSIRIRYKCRCDCGKMRVLEAYRLVDGHVKSCGCLRSDAASEAGKKKRKHGFASNGNRIPEYMVWVRMRRRCENPKSQDYPNYGARGIRVCRRWERFENFLEDMGRRPGDNYLIDRINNDGNYEPGNCKWSTITASNRNKRSIRYLTIDEVQRPLWKWVKISGTHPETIRSRLRRGWDEKEAVFGEIRQKMERVGNRWAKRS